MTRQESLQVVEQALWGPRCAQLDVVVLHLLGLCVGLVLLVALGAASLVQGVQVEQEVFHFALRVVCLVLFAP